MIARGTASRRRIERSIASSLALAAILGQLVHGAGERGREHVRCSDHGELVHLPEAAGGRAAGRDHRTLEAGADPDGDSHDVCLVVAERTRTSPPISVPHGAPRRDACKPQHMGEAAVSPRVALFRLAPKNSPPG